MNNSISGGTIGPGTLGLLREVPERILAVPQSERIPIEEYVREGVYDITLKIDGTGIVKTMGNVSGDFFSEPADIATNLIIIQLDGTRLAFSIKRVKLGDCSRYRCTLISITPQLLNGEEEVRNG